MGRKGKGEGGRAEKEGGRKEEENNSPLCSVRLFDEIEHHVEQLLARTGISLPGKHTQQNGNQFLQKGKIEEVDLPNPQSHKPHPPLSWTD